ncbi:hypothetical protein GALMADRAFT_225849 [Galerina marginata CBS 339.88]|uniref:Uncharacterized protein n=1 Tax=Galerina marginata (strain CBS 339.88) TaxID=685588 RepID=A0A067SZ01_GALM3|nr:hypothetical protein GALMADRAFT_225849 [Galerina marginata CBS 339.88]
MTASIDNVPEIKSSSSTTPSNEFCAWHVFKAVWVQMSKRPTTMTASNPCPRYLGANDLYDEDIYSATATARIANRSPSPYPSKIVIRL